MSPFRPAVAIFLLTIALRGFVLFRTPLPEFLYGHMTEHGFLSGEEGINVAVALSQRGEFADPFAGPTGPTAHLPPAFPLVTSAIFRVFGYGRAAASVRNGINIVGFALLYASLPAAAAALGLGANAGIIAGMGAAIFPAFRSSEVFRGRDEWAAAFVLLWLTIQIYRICTRPESGTRDAIIFGVGWGLLLYIQPSVVTLLPVHALICLWYSDRDTLKRRLSQFLLAAAIIAAMLFPWTIRNYRTMGAWFFLRDNAGLELRVSNGDGAQASQEANQRVDWYCSIHPICSAAAVAEIRRVGEVEFNRQLLRESVSWIAGHPQRFSQLTLARIAAFWADLPLHRSWFAVRLLWSLGGWLGLFFMWRDGYRVQTLFLLSLLIVYPLVYYIVQYSNRYVVPICFGMFLPAGFGAERLYSALRGRNRVPHRD